VLYRAESLAVRESEGELFLLIYAFSVGLFILAVVLLSTAGTFAMMSFTVSQRTREIGIRTALGANARQVVGDIFGRAMWQLGAGAALGLGAGWSASLVFAAAGFFSQGPGLPLAVAALIFAMGLFACGRPMRRALQVEPTEALRDGT
jgi:ABC-type antimicrobial peptide transport system permease subunit